MVLSLFSVVCVFVGLYFLRTEIKIALTRCHILRLKCTKIDFFGGSAGGSLQRSPRPSSWIKGALLLREGRVRKEGNGEWKGEGRGWKKEGGRDLAPPQKKISGAATEKNCDVSSKHRVPRTVTNVQGKRSQW